MSESMEVLTRGLSIIAVRDPDGGVDITVYQDGQRMSGDAYDIVEVDAGAGGEWSDWQQSIEEAEALPESELRDDLVAALNDPPGAGYIEGWQEKCSRCGERYDESKGDGFGGLCPSCADATEPYGEEPPDETDEYDDAEPTPSYVAKFTPEAWVKDYAVEVDAEGPTEWTVSEQFTTDAARIVTEDENGLDRDDVLKGDPAAPAWVREWSGPFSIHVRDNERKEG